MSFGCFVANSSCDSQNNPSLEFIRTLSFPQRDDDDVCDVIDDNDGDDDGRI